jgi:hypothetical protein
MNQWIRPYFYQTYKGWLVVMIIDNHLEGCICSKTLENMMIGRNHTKGKNGNGDKNEDISLGGTKTLVISLVT